MYCVIVNRSTAEKLWAQLGDVPIDEDECIEVEFLGFRPGTSRYEIWQWFEGAFNLSVADDLMYRNEGGKR